jgi:hypothetical protein
MSEAKKNGRHKRPRTTSHVPRDATTPAGLDGSTPTAADAATGRLDALAAPPSSTVSNGRDSRGRFGPSNAYGKGHAGHKRMAELRGAVLEAATPEILFALTRTLAKLALEGDVAAARLLLEYSCGKSVQPVEIAGHDGGPLERSAELSTALGAALSPFSEEVRFAVLGVIRKAVHAGRAE